MALNPDVLREFNTTAISLNGLPLVNSGDLLRHTRLAPYALVILFYKMAKVLPAYSYEAVLPLLSDPTTTLQDVVNVNG